MRELADIRDQLKVGLSEHPPEGSMPVTEMAEKIKALREVNSIEAAPERTGTRKATRAERPVTARIRERIGEQRTGVQVEQESAGHAGATQPAMEVKPEEQPLAPLSAVITMSEPIKPDHRQSVTRRRKEKEAQLRLF